MPSPIRVADTMHAMAGTGAGTQGPNEPGERDARRRAEAPAARYAQSRPGPPTGRSGAALTGPFARAVAAALTGSVALTLVGAVLASTFGLLFAAGLTGGAVGLLLARAAVPRDENLAPTPRRTVAWLAVGLSLAAVVLAGLLTWLIARQEGGTLDLIDYLLTTFGPFVPAEAVIAAVAAWWGASAGPIQS